MTLLNPLQITSMQAHEYVQQITTRSTADLHDDYQMIWLLQPESGYGDLHDVIHQLREAIIQELRDRPGIPVRPRLATRLGMVQPAFRSKVMYWLHEPDHDVASSTFVNTNQNNG
jgi:hypothetical protein